MKTRAFVIGLVLSVVICFPYHLCGQNIVSLTDCPFVADTVADAAGHITLGRKGRARDGSWFVDRLDAEGHLISRQIHDVTNQRNITFGTAQRTFIIMYPGKQNYEIIPKIEAEEHLERNIESGVRSGYPDLGTRQEAGLTLRGYRNSDPLQPIETWESARLGFTYSYIWQRPSESAIHYYTTNIREQEPDPTFFSIPEGYKPAIVR